MIRTLAAASGVPYSVAARQIDRAHRSIDWYANEMLAGQGRTPYPVTGDAHRLRQLETRLRRSFAERVRDARQAADPPSGRARHLADRFPPTRGEPGSGVELLYHGEHRQEALALLYTVVANECPELVPSIGDLAAVAELGEETAVDIACARLDRTARLFLDHDLALFRPRVAAALAAGRIHTDVRIRSAITALAGWWRAHPAAVGVTPAGPTAVGPTPAEHGRPEHEGPGPGGDVPLARGGPRRPVDEESGTVAAIPPFDGVRQILDALLTVADDGHAPGTRVQILAGAYQGGTGTIVGAVWGPAGPPVRYRVRPDDGARAQPTDPFDLVVLSRSFGP